MLLVSGVTGSEATQKVTMENYVFSTPFALRDFAGVSDIEILGPYVKTQWRDYQKKGYSAKSKVYEPFIIVFI
jgi:hypothetical protein